MTYRDETHALRERVATLDEDAEQLRHENEQLRSQVRALTDELSRPIESLDPKPRIVQTAAARETEAFERAQRRRIERTAILFVAAIIGFLVGSGILIWVVYRFS